VDWIGYLLDEYSANFAIFCSDLIEIISEYRVYVLNGRILSVCFYSGDRSFVLDMMIVEEAVKRLCESEEGRQLCGCGIDFAVMRKSDGEVVTGLVEVNDGFSLGAYEGLTGKDYTDILIARWMMLVNVG